jgi:hypothetical protein
LKKGYDVVFVVGGAREEINHPHDYDSHLPPNSGESAKKKKIVSEMVHNFLKYERFQLTSNQ